MKKSQKKEKFSKITLNCTTTSNQLAELNHIVVNLRGRINFAFILISFKRQLPENIEVEARKSEKTIYFGFLH